MDQGLVPLVFEFLHFLDAAKLATTCKRVNNVIENLWKMDQTFSRLVIHGLDSSSEILDIKLSDRILEGPREEVTRSLVRYSNASSVVLYNYEESSYVFRENIFPLVKKSLRNLELHNVTSLAAGDWGLVESLKLGLNMGPDSAMEPIRIPGLKFLEIRGLEISSASFRWLIETLSCTEKLEFLRITVTNIPDKIDMSDWTVFPKWEGGNLLSIELMVSSDRSMSNAERIVFSEFSNTILELSLRNPFSSIQTLTMNCSPSPNLWSQLTESSTLMHLVITNCHKMDIDLKNIASIIKSNSAHMQIFILKFAGGSNIHFDSLIQIILSAAPVPPLERLELEVVMDDTCCVMDTPFHSIKAATTLRCRYRDHLYFYRTRFGIAMASERAYCTDTELDITNVCSPMELFREEMVRGMMENPYDSGALEAEMINQWNLVHQVARSIYVEIFDDFIDHYLTADDGEKCDVSATIANLRE
jgi:hypothetical protein